jgi:hypothetical protein
MSDRAFVVEVDATWWMSQQGFPDNDKDSSG